MARLAVRWKVVDKSQKTMQKKLIADDGKSVITLIGGTAAAQALNFAFSPVVTRLFTPEVFGDLSVFSSITGIIGVVICLRYELAIILPEDDNEGFALLRLCLFFALIISFLAGLVFFLYGEAIYAKFGAPSLAVYWYYVPINLLLTGIVLAGNYWLTRTQQFAAISVNKIVPVLVVNLVSIGLGFCGDKGIRARLQAILLSNIANVIVICSVVVNKCKLQKNNNISFYKNMVKKYRRFFIYDVWGALLNNLSWMIVPIIMNAYYGSNSAGQYSIGMRVIQIPASIIGASITQVFIKTANGKRNEAGLYQYCINTIKKLLLYTFPAFVALLLLSKPLFHLFFGARWDLAGTYTQILAPWALLWFCASPMHSVFAITQKQNIFLVFSILNLVTRFFSLYLGKMLGNDLLGISFFSISGFIIYGFSLFLALYEAKRNDMLNVRLGSNNKCNAKSRP